MPGDERRRNGRSETPGAPVSVLLIADPGEPATVAEGIAQSLPQRLRGRERVEQTRSRADEAA